MEMSCKMHPSGVSRAYVGLGSNLGDRCATLRAARVDRLAGLGGRGRTRRSTETDPVGLERPAAVPERRAWRWIRRSSPSPAGCAAGHRGASSGRVRGVRWGPRTLDLDLIWYEDGARARRPR